MPVILYNINNCNQPNGPYGASNSVFNRCSCFPPDYMNNRCNPPVFCITQSTNIANLCEKAAESTAVSVSAMSSEPTNTGAGEDIAPKATGSIIPFASGLPVVLTTVAGGAPGKPGLIGFGNSVSLISGLGSAIDLTGTGNLINFALCVPRDGIVTSIAAHFNTSVALALAESNVTIQAQLYASATPGNIFSPLPGTLIKLSPGLTGNVSIGMTADGIAADISVPVAAKTRLLMVFSATASESSLANSVAGYASAGVIIK